MSAKSETEKLTEVQRAHADSVRRRMRALKAQFSRVWISDRDFEEVAQFIGLWERASEEGVQKALLIAATIAYARPFTDNKRGKNNESIASIPVDLSKVLVEPGQIELHEKIVTLRNEGIAHSDYARRAAQWSFGQDNGYMTWARPFDVRFEIAVPADLRELALTLKTWCAHKMRSLNHLLIQCEKDLGEYQPLDA